MRVLHFIDSLRAGGKERQAVSLLKGLRRAEIDVLLAVMQAHDFFEHTAVSLGVTVRYIERRWRWDPSVFVRLGRLVDVYRPDVIHTHDWMTSLYALPLAKTRDVPLVNGSIRNAFRSGGVRWHAERVLLVLSDAIIANSSAGLKSRGFDVRSDRRVVHNGFDFGRLSGLVPPEELRASWNLQQQQVVGMVALFKSHKDYPTFLRAAESILKERDDVVFLAVGDGEELESCKKSVAAGTKGILFLGRTSDVESVVNACDVCVLATHGEGISNAVLEYMAAGKPVIVSEGGGTDELVVDGRTGFLVPQRNAGIMAARICQLLDNPGLGREMGTEGQRRVKAVFALDRLTQQTIDIYESLVQRRRERAEAYRAERSKRDG